MKNIILIGMPGTGKSVVGRALADRLHYTFVDVDNLIVQAAGQPLSEILRSQGLDAFLALEGQIGEALTCENTVIATGGKDFIIFFLGHDFDFIFAALIHHDVMGVGRDG